MSDLNLSAIAIVVILAVVLVSLVLFFVSRYKRCPANKILVISGTTEGNGAAKTIAGGGAFVWPVIQEAAFLDLTPIQINIPLKDALSLENIRVAVPSVFTVAIGTDPVTSQNAAMRLLGLGQQEIVKAASDMIFGQLRQVIASMRIEEINRDREALLKKIQTSLEPELRKVGLVLINVNITDLRDDSGYIEAIGRKAASEAVQQARGDVALQEKIGEVRVAEAERDRTVSVAEAQRMKEIGLKENEREKLVRTAELAKEQRIGEQQAAFEAEVAITKAEQSKRVAVAEANAVAIAGEAEAQARVIQTKAELQVREAQAFLLAQTKKQEAEAAVSEATNRAQAAAARANAERIEAEQRAALEAPMKAEKARRIVEAEAQAEQVRLAAMAEAEAIKLKLQAQAEGEYQILAKKAQALGEMVKQAGSAEAAFQLLMIEQLPSLAEINAKAIQGVKFDKVVVWDGGQGGTTGTGGAAGFLNSLVRAVPPALEVLRDVGGVKLPEALTPTEGPAPADA